MTSMDATYHTSPDMAPATLADSPAPITAQTDSTAPPRAKPVKRTYGTRKVEVEESSRALEKEATVIVPETDFDAVGRTSSSEGDRTLMQSRRKVSSSSPTRRDDHSTDPTSEDDAKSDGTDSEDEDDAVQAFLARGNIKDLLANVDREMDSRADAPLPTPAATRPPACSSDLTPLNTTQASSTLPPLTSSQALTAAAAPTSESGLDEIFAALPPLATDEPVFRNKKPAARVADSEEDDEEDVVRQPSRKGKQRAVLDSSDADEEDARSSSPALTRAPLPSPPLPSARERVAALAAKKRKDLPEVFASKRILEDAEDKIDGDDEGRRSLNKKRKEKRSSLKQPRAKGLSKKEMEEMNKTTAAMARTLETRLEPTRKAKYSVTDALKKVKQQPFLPTPPLTNANPNTLTLSSTDPIDDGSSSPAPAAVDQAYALNMPGQHRPSSPIASHDDATPTLKRSRTTSERPRLPPPSLEWTSKLAKTKAAAAKADQERDEESEDDLVSLDEVFAKQQKEKEARAKKQLDEEEKRERLRRLNAQKLAAVKASRPVLVADSDSDIEIQDRPGQVKKASPVKARRSKLDVFEQVKNEGPNPHAAVHKMLRNVAGIDTSHPRSDDHDDPTQSQMEAAGRNFGHHLEPKLEYAGTPTKASKKRSSRRVVDIDHDHLNKSLLGKTQTANLKTRLAKQTKQRQQTSAQAERPGLASVDVKEMLERKRLQEKEDDAMDLEEELAADGDYQDSAEEDEEAGSAGSGDDDLGLTSGSDVPNGRDGRKKEGEDEEDEEGEVDSDGELRMPPSSQNSDRFGRVEEDEEESAMLPPATSRGKQPRIVDDEDEETHGTASTSTTPAATELATSAPAPDAGRVAFGGLFGGDDAGADGGFSQFFNSQFSQDAGGDAGGQDGFLRPNDDDFDGPSSTMFIGQPLISTAERAADAARLGARGGFNDFEPGTPREAPAARQYINQQGFLTQTRPANLFADSPSDSPAFASIRQCLSVRDSESQFGGDTQAQTPTQISKDPTKLRRLDAMTAYDDLPTTEPAPTNGGRPPSEDFAETQEAEETQEEKQQTAPTTAQPPTAAEAAKNAFDLLRAAQSTPAAVPAPKKKRPERSAFVDDQANLSDEEEIGLGGVSGDENEVGMDDELESLVDNEEVDKELRDEQDALVDDLFADDMQKQHEEDLKRAQRIADGKERNKRKGIDLDDDEFDDEYHGRERVKRTRVDNKTTEDLKKNEETKRFAETLTDSCIATSKPDEYSFLNGDDQDELVEEDEEEEEGGDVFGGEAALKTSFLDVREMALEAQRRKEQADDMMDFDGEDDEHHRYPREASVMSFNSSPAKPVEVNHRILNVTASKASIVPPVDEYEAMESQYSLMRHDSIQSNVPYKGGDARDESQGAATAAGRSAVTSFRKPLAGAKSSTSALPRGGKSGMALGAKASKLGYRKGGSGFAS